MLGLMEGRIRKEPCALIQIELEAKNSGRWRWVLPRDPFHPWKLDSACRDDLCGRYLCFDSEYRRGEHGELLYFEVYLLPTCLRTSHETLFTDSEVAPMSQKACQGLKIFVPQRDQFTAFCIPGGIWHLHGTEVVGLWPVSNLRWYFTVLLKVFPAS